MADTPSNFIVDAIKMLATESGQTPQVFIEQMIGNIAAPIVAKMWQDTLDRAKDTAEISKPNEQLEKDWVSGNSGASD